MGLFDVPLVLLGRINHLVRHLYDVLCNVISISYSPSQLHCSVQVRLRSQLAAAHSTLPQERTERGLSCTCFLYRPVSEVKLILFATKYVILLALR